MNPTIALSTPGRSTAQATRDLLLILLFALAVRLLLINGEFGSDDLVYFARSLQLARGEWSSADYNGALRYGFNLPAAGFIALFGESLLAANLWPLACSLIEIGAVYLFANAVMGRRAAIFAALLLASAPLHIAVAMRIHADPVVSMFITLGFVLLYFGALRRAPMLLFCAGLSIGGIFWAKELASVTWFAFLPMLWFFRGQWRNVLYVIAGAALMMVLHGALMGFIAGDPLHLVKVVLGAVKRNFVDGGDGEDGAAYYLRHLFVDLRHVGVLAFFAAASALLMKRVIKQDSALRSGFTFTLLWWIGLLTVLSLFPVSISPLRLAMKESNYITLFLAPTALLAGMAIASLPRRSGQLALALCVTFGLLLGALEQADYRVFAANSKAVAAFAADHPRAAIVGSSHASRLGNLLLEMNAKGSSFTPIVAFRDLGDRDGILRRQLGDAETVFAVLDRQTLSWYPGKHPINEALPCWQHEQTLEPVGLGLGNELAGLMSRLLGQFKPLAALADSLERLAQPRRADVYRVIGNDVLCADS
jgi:4-amino-4-deoxy-L-arabinose transferase-like glycosyltransferase